MLHSSMVRRLAVYISFELTLVHFACPMQTTSWNVLLITKTLCGLWILCEHHYRQFYIYCRDNLLTLRLDQHGAVTSTEHTLTHEEDDASMSTWSTVEGP